MSDSEEVTNLVSGAPVKAAYLAAFIALIGLADAVYLTVKHFKNEQVPCSLVTGCEQVLTSSYAEIFGIPTAFYGAVAYFLAFSLAILAAFGNRRMWFIFGLLTTVMLIFTVWLTYVQGFLIEAFCQFCLLSAATTLTLFVTAVAAKFWRYR